MKKLLFGLLISIALLATACGSSNVADYSGKDATQTEAENDAISEEVSETEETQEDETDSTADDSYHVNIARFDITESSFEDGYRYEAIVAVENTGNSNIYLAGTAFDIEDANGALIQSDDMVSCCPDVIKPGETGYLYNQFGDALDGVTNIEGLQLSPQYVVKTTKQTPDEYDVSDVSIKNDTFGVTVVGRVTNNTDKDQSYLYIQVLYFDGNGDILGISGTSITDLLAGRTVSFEIPGIDLPNGVTMENISDYKVVAQETFYGW